MNMQMAITGRGGQGVLFLTRILTECALELEQEVIASETHGMAIRGGSVISTLKVGSFRGPLIRSGKADVMLVLDEGSLQTFFHLLSPSGVLFLNAPKSEAYPFIDATGLAAGLGFPLLANLILLSFSLSAALGAVAGIILTPITTTSYDVGVMLGLKSFAAAILGGYGSMIGAVVGGLLLGVLESLAAGLVSSEYKDVLAFFVLLTVLFFKPNGIFGKGYLGQV